MTLAAAPPFSRSFPWKKRILLGLAAALLPFCLGSPGRAAEAACFAQDGHPIDCAGTGQDGETRAGRPWPVPRFRDHGDGTVTDHLSGLMWLKDGGCLAETGWRGALEGVQLFNSGPAAFNCRDYTASYTDWTLPNLQELQSLISGTAPDQAAWLNELGFVGVRAAGYWTATTHANPYNGWLVDLAPGSTLYGPKIDRHAVWPCRRTEAGPQLAKTGQTETFGPADDGALQHGIGWPSPRFTPTPDGTVVDHLTGLAWRRQAGEFARREWQAALAAAKAFNKEQPSVDGAGEWRLPNPAELQSLLDYSRDYPALPADHPFAGLGDTFYWTSATSAVRPEAAWAVHPLYGDKQPRAKSEQLGLWLVLSQAAAGPARPWQSAPWKVERRTALFQAYQPPEAEKNLPDRFVANGDGTITDRTTGLIWLADAGCIGKVDWETSVRAVTFLNEHPGDLNCDGYSGTFQDWELPDLAMLRTLLNSSEPTVNWLKKQGFTKVQANYYWTANDSKLNIYYATPLHLKNEQAHPYPKTLRFFAWPVRPGTDITPPAGLGHEDD